LCKIEVSGHLPPGQQHQKKPVCFPTDGTFHLSTQDDQLLPQQRVFRQLFGFASGQIGECTNHGGGRWWLYPPQNVFLKRMEAEKDALLDRGKRTAHK
jgi:hypothetical protein